MRGGFDSDVVASASMLTVGISVARSGAFVSTVIDVASPDDANALLANRDASVAAMSDVRFFIRPPASTTLQRC
jgi:hypothetical protein